MSLPVRVADAWPYYCHICGEDYESPEEDVHFDSYYDSNRDTMFQVPVLRAVSWFVDPREKRATCGECYRAAEEKE